MDPGGDGLWLEGKRNRLRVFSNWFLTHVKSTFFTGYRNDAMWEKETLLNSMFYIQQCTFTLDHSPRSNLLLCWRHGPSISVQTWCLTFSSYTKPYNQNKNSFLIELPVRAPHKQTLHIIFSLPASLSNNYDFKKYNYV